MRCTRDRHTILCHDPKLNRLVLRRHTLRRIQESCHASDGMPPSLEDVLDRYRKEFLNIEVKVRGIEPTIVAAIRRVRPKDYFISSFLPGVVRRLHALDASLVLGTVAKTRWQLRRWRALPVSYVVPHYRLLTRRLVEKVHEANKKVVTWTVNEPRRMLRAAALGVDAIISDDTKLLVETLAKHKVG